MGEHKTEEHVCGCGRGFAKGFGLRVHQRTCAGAGSCGLHDKRCIAAALICAVENARDSELSVAELVELASSGDLYRWAASYIRDGLTACRCVTPVRTSR